MKKHNYFVTFLKKINLSINILLKKYLNKLNFNNISAIALSNKIFVAFVALVILIFSYLSIPSVFEKSEIHKELKDQLYSKFNLNFQLGKNLKYNFFPRPHFINENSTIFNNQNEVSKIRELKIYVSLKNLFSLGGITINNLIIENANFNLNNQTYNFFTELLFQNLKDSNILIKNSNIFYKNSDDEVLFINKIEKIKYYYDLKYLRNTVKSKNEIFNLPYSLELYYSQDEKKIFSKLNFDFLKLQILNEMDYNDELRKGLAKLVFNKQKSDVTYQFSKSFFKFNFFDKINDKNFSYEGNINFDPFYSNLKGSTKNIDLSAFINSNALIAQFLKTEILYNKNLNFHFSIIGEKIYNYENFKNISLNSKIQDSLIDLDETKFTWKDNANFVISDSLIHVKNNELILDAKLDIVIKKSDEIYKSFLTPKNYRKEIKKIELSFNYNFDQKILKLNDIKIDNKLNQKLNKSLKILMFKDDRLQNKIYFKNKINKAIKYYAG
jgi:hypothetical protein